LLTESVYIIEGSSLVWCKPLFCGALAKEAPPRVAIDFRYQLRQATLVAFDFVGMPLQIRTHPKKAPLLCAASELELCESTLCETGLPIPMRAPLDDRDVVPLHPVLDAELILEPG
jgi:hypothetical protein